VKLSAALGRGNRGLGPACGGRVDKITASASNRAGNWGSPEERGSVSDQAAREAKPGKMIGSAGPGRGAPVRVGFEVVEAGPILPKFTPV
jgi:hypothetical protein